MTLQNPFQPGAYILIEPTVLSGIAIYRQMKPQDPEAGGILLGLRRGDHLHCTGYTSPGPQDQRARTGFHRARRYHQAQALAHWTKSGGLIDYLGEWHTHPEPRPRPSGTDRREWRLLMGRYDAPLLFAIFGTDEHVWVGVGLNGSASQAPAIENLSLEP